MLHIGNNTKISKEVNMVNDNITAVGLTDRSGSIPGSGIAPQYSRLVSICGIVPIRGARQEIEVTFLHPQSNPIHFHGLYFFFNKTGAGLLIYPAPPPTFSGE